MQGFDDEQPPSCLHYNHSPHPVFPCRVGSSRQDVSPLSVRAFSPPWRHGSTKHWTLSHWCRTSPRMNQVGGTSKCVGNKNRKTFWLELQPFRFHIGFIQPPTGLGNSALESCYLSQRPPRHYQDHDAVSSLRYLLAPYSAKHLLMSGR